MDKQTKQLAGLYFDLERIRTNVVTAFGEIEQAHQACIQVYLEEHKEYEKTGKPVPSRGGLETATRAGISAQLNQLFPLLNQIVAATNLGQEGCLHLAPQLNGSKTTH
jgi:hypothetical protein